MYLDAAFSTQGGKTYRRYLLRESYRHEGKVKHRTIANLSHCSEEEIAAIKLALRHKGDLAQLGSVQELNAQQGARIGAVCCLLAVARRLGLAQALGSQRAGKLALWQVFARLMDQGSRLSAVRLAESHAAGDLLAWTPSTRSIFIRTWPGWPNTRRPLNNVSSEGVTATPRRNCFFMMSPVPTWKASTTSWPLSVTTGTAKKASSSW